MPPQTSQDLRRQKPVGLRAQEPTTSFSCPSKSGKQSTSAFLGTHPFLSSAGTLPYRAPPVCSPVRRFLRRLAGAQRAGNGGFHSTRRAAPGAASKRCLRVCFTLPLGGGFFQCILSFALPPTNIAPGNGKAEPSMPSRWQTWLPVAPVAEVPNGQKTLMERSADTSRTRGKLHQLHQRSTHAARLALAGAPGVDAPGGRRSSGQGRPLPLATAGPVRFRARCSVAHLDLGAQRASRSCARSLGEGTYRFQAACVDLRSICLSYRLSSQIGASFRAMNITSHQHQTGNGGSSRHPNSSPPTD